MLNEIIYEAVAGKTISNYPARTDIGCDSEKSQQNKESSVPERNQRDPQNQPNGYVETISFNYTYI